MRDRPAGRMCVKEKRKKKPASVEYIYVPSMKLDPFYAFFY